MLESPDREHVPCAYVGLIHTSVTPGGIDQYFVDAGTPALEEGLRPQPIDFQQLAAISAQYGMEILGPSPF